MTVWLVLAGAALFVAWTAAAVVVGTIIGRAIHDADRLQR